jgi:hypothetical protein
MNTDNTEIQYGAAFPDLLSCGSQLVTWLMRFEGFHLRLSAFICGQQSSY